MTTGTAEQLIRQEVARLLEAMDHLSEDVRGVVLLNALATHFVLTGGTSDPARAFEAVTTDPAELAALAMMLAIQTTEEDAS